MSETDSDPKGEPKGEPKSVLSRWSERKLAARRGEVADEPVVQAPGVDPPPAVLPEAEAPMLPPIETLDFHSDFTVFLAKSVPEALRRAALRKLWVSDPVLANLDGLNDYDEDYNLIDQAITLAQSGYRPGLGYLDEATKELDAAEKKLEQFSQPTSVDSPSQAVASDRPSSAGEASDNVAGNDVSVAAVQNDASAGRAPGPSIRNEESEE